MDSSIISATTMKNTSEMIIKVTTIKVFIITIRITIITIKDIHNNKNTNKYTLKIIIIIHI